MSAASTSGRGGGGCYIIEARRMPFADVNAPKAHGPDAFMASIRNAVSAVVRGNHAFDALVGSEADLDNRDDANTASLWHYFTTTVDHIVREMDDLEGTYFTTIDRMEQIRQEEGDDDDDDGDAESQRPAVAMKFDDAGRVLGIGTFSLPHGYHDSPQQSGGRDGERK